MTDEDNSTGVWMEPGRNLEYYILKNGDIIEYRKKLRYLKVKMLDGKSLTKWSKGQLIEVLIRRAKNYAGGRLSNCG